MRVNDKSPKEKEAIRQVLRARDGNLCQIDFCMTEEDYRKKSGRDFDIHHISENPDDWDWNNLVLAAHGCNVRETPHGKIDYTKNFESQCNSLKQKKVKYILERARERTGEDGNVSVGSAEHLRSIELSPIAEEEFKKIITEHEEVDKGELIRAMANVSGLKDQTCRRYVNDKTNIYNGEYEEFPRDINGEKIYFIRKRQ